MKLQAVLDMVDKIKPGNPYDTATKIQWLNELEGDIQSRLLKTAPQEIIQYTEENLEETLLVPVPYDKVYWMWVAAMIDFANGEYQKYQNTLQMVNDAYDKYAKWFHRHFHQDTGGFLFIGGTTKYGLSAYEIAGNHGFAGSEEEWLASLKGKDGEPGKNGSFEDLTDEQKESLRGPKGDPFTYDDFTPEQLTELKGEPGKPGHTPVKGEDYFTDADKEEIAEMVKIDQIDAEKVYFSRDLETTFEIGTVKLTNGKGTVSSNGKNLVEVWDTIFLQEKNPSTTQPSVSLTFSQAGAYEVGTKLTPSYGASLKAGSYTYGPATGITPSSWAVNDTPGNKKTTASGSFPELTVTDDMSYKVTATATYNDGAIPVTNRGNPYSAGQIKAGSKSATSNAVTGYRNTFHGTLEAKTAVTSSVVRGLSGKSGAALANGSAFTVDIPVGALRVVIAYPATLQDVTSIKDVNGMGAEISSSFTKQTVKVEGANGYSAIEYKVYTMDFASANDTANTYDVII